MSIWVCGEVLIDLIPDAPGSASFTVAGNYSWTVPNGVYYIGVTVIGAGGGGGRGPGGGGRGGRPGGGAALRGRSRGRAFCRGYHRSALRGAARGDGVAHGADC